MTKFLSVAALGLSLVLAVGCGKEGSANAEDSAKKQQLVGSWQQTANIKTDGTSLPLVGIIRILTFTADGKGRGYSKEVGRIERNEGSYRVEGNTIITKTTGAEGESKVEIKSLTADTLVISQDGMTASFKRITDQQAADLSK